MTSLLYTLKKGDYVIKRVSSNESYKAPKESMQFRQTLIEPIVKVKKATTSKDIVEPPGYLVRAKSALHKSRLMSEVDSDDNQQILMRTPSKMSCGIHCVDGTFTWIGTSDLSDYVNTMTHVSVGRVEQNIKLFDMSDGIKGTLISRNPTCIGCIHRVLSDGGDSLIPYNGCEILNIYRKLLRENKITSSGDGGDEGTEFDMILSMIFGSSRLSLESQVVVLEGYQQEMVDYVKSKFSCSDSDAKEMLWKTCGNDLWSPMWGEFTKKYGFSVSDGNITPYRLIEEWKRSLDANKLKSTSATRSQRCSIYSADLLAVVMLCIISEVNEYDTFGYKYSPRNKFRLKDEQQEYCLNSSAMKNMVDWAHGYESNVFISDLHKAYAGRSSVGGIKRSKKKGKGKGKGKAKGKPKSKRLRVKGSTSRRSHVRNNRRRK